ncbi:phosphoinositide 3-kinase adapter protein 1-like isoform X3 [Acipenser ruthenus]|uniref:phosphoinositide 3-kinase adapter protein 1-like isoform X3 n=1 Tax=Acipenser ruthenus TaxID=7906 RepID=UPI0027407B1F|nr:phosphoinositide 3-kinase adapter protein 1-like isoform X3 [Acipenser ruthenus]
MCARAETALKVLSEVLIVYTKDAVEWSTYLQNVLVSCKHFSTKSVLLYEVESHTPVAEQDISIFQNSRCIILLLSGELLDVLGSFEVLESFRNVLQPPGKMVMLFYGVTETEMLSECFQDWHQWKQLDPEDEPTTYISVVRQAVSEEERVQSLHADGGILFCSTCNVSLDHLRKGCDSVTDSEVEVEAEAEMEAEAEDEGDVEAEDEGDVEAEAEDEGDVEAEAEDKGDVEAEAEDEGDVEAEAEDEGDVEAEAEDEGDVEVEVEDEGGVEAEVEVEAEYEVEAEVEAEEEREAEAEDEGEVEDEGEEEVEMEAHDEAEAEDEGEVEVEAADEGETEVEAEVDTELVCSTESWQHVDPQPQPDRSVHGNCITIQPDRIRCGAQMKMYLILKCKLDNQVKTQVEFSSKDCSSKRESAVLENEYTVSVKAPDMHCGPVSVTLFSGDLTVCSTSVTYYTDMEEIGNYLLSAINPIQFLCQAFKITTNNIEALDQLLTESLKNNIPASGLQLFGINQLEEENMSAYQRNEELPTLLHFAAKYGLKKLTGLLLHCPGALQAYSVVNKYGEYPNNIAEKNGFKDLREFMDEYVETAEMLKTHIKDNITQGEDEQTYESMSNMSRDILTKYSLNPGCDEDIYECMVELNTDSMEDIYEDMEKQPESSRDIQDPFFAQESMLRKFLEGKSSTSFDSAEEGEQEEEDPYKLCIDEDVYDTVEPGAIHPPEIINRPPAPIPRPSVSQEPQEPYISKVFSAREEAKLENLYAVVEPMSGLVRPVRDRSSTTTYDPYGGMKTPGQRQLIALQEKVKVGIFTVEEAVQQFKEWQLNQKSRGESFKFQEENLRKLRDSITRRQKEKSKTGKPLDLQITAPIRQFQGPPMKLECAVYESNARVLAAPPPPSQPINRGNWQTGSTTSTSTGSASNRSSTRSNMSFSSGAEGDNEDNVDNYRSPSPLPHAAEKLPELPPPRLPPRTPARPPESTNMDRYAPCPTRHVPGPRRCSPLPPVPRRTR